MARPMPGYYKAMFSVEIKQDYFVSIQNNTPPGC